MMRVAVTTMACVTLASLVCGTAQAQRILYLTKSQGFEHEAVKRDGDKPGFSERVIKQLADQNGAEFTATKDASLINAENLKNYDLVIFYSTGDLTQPTEGRDEPPMGPNGLQDLTQWIENGGGFMGYHAATDTFGTPEGQEPTPYTKLIGATFAAHWKQFEGTVVAVDEFHPTMLSMPKEFKIHEEWYTFRNFDTQNMHVLALLDPGPERQVQPQYNIPAYPIIWCKTLGKGRIYYNGLGHNETVWNDPVFQASIVDAAQWALGQTPAQAEPNFDKVVPKEIPSAEAPKAEGAEQP
jgi:type 1 glutamine amidotransferase